MEEKSNRKSQRNPINAKSSEKIDTNHTSQHQNSYDLFSLSETDIDTFTLLESTSDGIFILDSDGNLIYTNKTVEVRLGMPCDKLQNLHYLDIIRPCDHKNIKRNFTRLMRGEEVPSFELEYYSARGEPVIVEVFSRPIRKNGKVIGILGISRNITERKKQEREINEREEWLKALTDQYLMGVIIIQDRRIRYCNQTAAELSGYTMDEIMLWDEDELLSLIHADDRQSILELDSIDSSGGSSPISHNTYRIITRSGTTKWIEIYKKPITYEGKPAHLYGLTDITEQKKAQHALLESEEIYRSLVQTSPDAIAVTDLEGRIIEISGQTLQLNGYDSPEEIIGKNAFELIAPDDREKAAVNLRETLVKGIVKGAEYTFLRKDGTTFIGDLNAALIRDSHNNPRAFIATIRDITERKSNEEKMKKLQEQLFQAQKMEAIGTLAGGIAHDFNNLLMGIQGNASLMFSDINQKTPVYDRLKSIEQHVQSGVSLTKQLLGFARGGRYEVKPVNVNEIIMQGAELFGRTHKDILIHKKMQDKIWTVEADQGQIEQVMMNIYVNAWQAMPAGGDLYIETRNMRLERDFARAYQISPGKYVKISVKDTGIGMDDKTRKRIFDPFFTTKEMGRGTGLGMASAYGIIKSHNGIIEVQSRIGEGTIFEIYLPASVKKTAGVKTDTYPIHTGKGVILLVDDEDMILNVCEQMLVKIGYRVLIARNGREAISTFRTRAKDIDMVILDMIMPDMWGGEIFSILKEIDPYAKVLLSSGYSSEGHAEKILEMGCSGFIQKPFTLEQLSLKIDEILRA